MRACDSGGKNLRAKMGRALFAVPVKAPIPLSDSITLPNRTSMSRQMKMQAGNWVCDSIRYDPIPTRVGGCGWRRWLFRL